MTFLPLFLLSALASTICAKPINKPRPLVFWHGLGDMYNAPGMTDIQDLIKDIYPGMFTYSIYMNLDGDEDKKATFYGNVNEQVAFAAEQLAGIPELEDGFDAIGFSQGGQFLRAYVERYNTPPVNNLITFGSQHMGITDIPACRQWDFLCKAARQAIKSSVYSSWAQQNLVQAQYFRDVENLPTYLEANEFLVSVNNELPEAKNETYAANLASLNALILVQFTQDKTVVPKESAWFGSEIAAPEGDNRFLGGQEVLTQSSSTMDEHPPAVLPMREHPIYKQDWIGLRALDERNAIVFSECEGEHMQLGDCWRPLVDQYVGGELD